MAPGRGAEEFSAWKKTTMGPCHAKSGCVGAGGERIPTVAAGDGRRAPATHWLLGIAIGLTLGLYHYVRRSRYEEPESDADETHFPRQTGQGLARRSLLSCRLR